MQLPSSETLQMVYGGDAERARRRFEQLVRRFEDTFSKDSRELQFFSSPGRTEIIGNHTDHNGGKILCASITMDTIGVAAPNGTDRVRIKSEGYPNVDVSISALGDTPRCAGPESLVAGMLEATLARGFAVQGFDATVSSEVIPAAGVSSSASFEMLVCAMVNHLFNDGQMDVPTRAHIGQYAENVWWEKGSGLMDQMACGVGGTIALDFSSGVSFEHVDFSFEELGCDLVLVNTGKGHAILTAEYSSVPTEMHVVANALGVTRLCETSEEDVLEHIHELRNMPRGDRAVLRSLHFFEECARVDEAVQALKTGDKEHLLQLISSSGDSSWKWLQNAYVTGSATEQSLAVALALTELYLKEVGRGACRLHGGGFAGVIMCVLPKDATAEYVARMVRVFGRGSVYRTNIRATGAVCL